VLIEFSLVVVLFFALLYGLISYGLMLALKQSVTNAATEGARAAIGADLIASYDTAEDGLEWLGPKCCRRSADVTGEPLTIDPVRGFCSPSATNPGDPECVTVSISYDFAGSPLLPPLPGFGLAFPDTIASSGVIQLP
jgi:hypothetical protein